MCQMLVTLLQTAQTASRQSVVSLRIKVSIPHIGSLTSAHSLVRSGMQLLSFTCCLPAIQAAVSCHSMQHAGVEPTSCRYYMSFQGAIVLAKHKLKEADYALASLTWTPDPHCSEVPGMKPSSEKVSASWRISSCTSRTMCDMRCNSICLLAPPDPTCMVNNWPAGMDGTLIADQSGACCLAAKQCRIMEPWELRKRT